MLKRTEHLLKRIENLITTYDHVRPFAIFLKHHFNQNRQMGARDRRDTRKWTYDILRLGLNLQEKPFVDRMCTALFLCESFLDESMNDILIHSPLGSFDLSVSVTEKIRIVKSIYPEFSETKIFPLVEHLSLEIERGNWFNSFFNRPFVYLRVKSDKLKSVLSEFTELKIGFEQMDEQPCLLTLPSDVSIDKTNAFLKGHLEIQDKNSQATASFMHPKSGEKWWDTCAASGGKSLLLFDLEKDIQVLATDARASILDSYTSRLNRSGIRNFKTEVVDLTMPFVPPLPFDGIIFDAPCSGSGTWSRNPEWLSAPEKFDLEHFVSLQRRIFSTVWPQLKTDGALIYITCSAFAVENELNIQFFKEKFQLDVEKMQYLKGYDERADTLFVSRLIKKG